MNYERVNWENGTEVEGAYVEIDGTRYPVVMPTYNCNTPITARNLNIMDKGIKEVADYIDARYKLLWEGTWSSGSINVNNLNRYNSILVYVDASRDPIPCYRDGNGNILGSVTLGSSNSNNYVKIFRAGVSGTTLTLNYARELGHLANGNHNAGENKTIYKIVGLDPKVE